MTREEAIAYGKRVIDLGLNDETQAFCEMAISALSENKTQMIDKSNFDAEQYKADLQSAYDCGYNKALSENERESINASEEESEDQSVEWYCTDCPYFQFTGEPSTEWYGTRCNKDNHEASPSMYAIQILNNNCPLNRR